MTGWTCVRLYSQVLSVRSETRYATASGPANINSTALGVRIPDRIRARFVDRVSLFQSGESTASASCVCAGEVVRGSQSWDKTRPLQRKPSEPLQGPKSVVGFKYIAGFPNGQPVLPRDLAARFKFAEKAPYLLPVSTSQSTTRSRWPSSRALMNPRTIRETVELWRPTALPIRTWLYRPVAHNSLTSS